MTSLRRTLKTMPWSAWLGLVAFALTLWALWIWLPPTPRERLQTADHVRPPGGYTSDGLFFTSSGRNLRFWDLTDGSEVVLRDEAGQPLEGIAYANGKGELLTLRDGQLLHRMDSGRYKRIDSLDATQRPFISSPGRTDTYLLRGEKQVSVRSLLGHPDFVIPINDPWLSWYPQLSPKGDLIAAAHGPPHATRAAVTEVALWEVRTGRMVAQLPCIGGGYPGEIRFSSNGRYLSVVVHSEPIPPLPTIATVWDLESQQPLSHFPGVNHVEFVAGDTRVLLAHARQWNSITVDSVTLVDLATGETAISLDCHDRARWVYAGGSDNKWFIVQNRTFDPGNVALRWLDGFIGRGLGQGRQSDWHAVYDARTGARVARFDGVGTLSADGATMVVYDESGEDPVVRLFDIPARRSWWRMLATAIAMGMTTALLVSAMGQMINFRNLTDG